MNKKNCILVLVILIILVIFIDLIFNFSKILYENFQTENKKLENSIVSKKDGRIININFLANDPNKYNKHEDRVIFLQSPLSNNKNIVLNNDGTLSETFVRTMDMAQQWKLIYINNKPKYNKYLGNSTNGNNTDNTCVRYPFYIILSNTPKKKALQYDYGALTCRPIGNYDSQKWDVSDETLKGKSIVIHNTLKNDGLNFRSNPDTNGSEVDPNKINLNFNIKNDLLKQIFGTDSISNESNGESKSSGSCGTYVPNDAIESLCPGCSPELFE